jgi:putative membrane protein
MIGSAVFAFIHFAAIFGIFATVFLEWQTLSRAPSLAEARRIQRCDRWYGIFAMLVLAAGFARALWFEKGWAFYRESPFFHWKLGLFILVGLLSIYPTVRFVKWGAQTRQGVAPVVSEVEYRRILWLLRAQLLLLLAVAFCATLMARGIGMR